MMSEFKNIVFYYKIEPVVQDTTKKPVSIPVLKDLSPFSGINDAPLIKPIIRKTFNEQNIDSIFKQYEAREQQYQQEIRIVQAKKHYHKTDTNKLFHENLGIYKNNLKENQIKDCFHENVLFNIPAVKKIESVKNARVYISSVQDKKENVWSEKQIQIIPRNIDSKVIFDWVSFVLFLSVVLLGWTRLFFNKYFVSVVKSAASYQEANSLFRERNTVIERVFFLLSILFLFTTSIFAIQLAHFYDLDLGDKFVLFLLVFISLIGLQVFRIITSSFIGFVFQKDKVFSEYMHNVKIFSINTGIFLLPIIILLQYLSFEYIRLIVYLGITGIVFLYLIQVLRSFQIINRKNVSIFYMILYLCAFEFVPFLIVYKLLLSLN